MEERPPGARLKLFIDQKLTARRAWAKCARSGGNLDSLNTVAKLSSQRKYLDAVGIDTAWCRHGYGLTSAWVGAQCIGCNDPNEDKWKWPSGDKLRLDHEMWERGKQIRKTSFAISQPSCLDKTELMDMSTLKWSDGPDYPYNPA